MTILQTLYQKFKSHTITDRQFITEVRKYPEFAQFTIGLHSAERVIKNLKAKRLLTEGLDRPNVQPQVVNPIDFNSIEDEKSQVHVVKVDLPSFIEFIVQDTLRTIGSDEIKKFIDVTYDGDTEGKEDEDIITDLIMSYKNDYENCPVSDKNLSLDELEGMKSSAVKIVRPKKSIMETLTYDQVSNHEYNIGFNIEMDKCKDVITASKKVLKNLSKSPSFYTDFLTKKDTQKELKPYALTKNNVVDTTNPLKKIKSLHEDLLKRIEEVEVDSDRFPRDFNRVGNNTDTPNIKLVDMIKKHFIEVQQEAHKYGWEQINYTIDGKKQVYFINFIKNNIEIVYDIVKSDLRKNTDKKTFVVSFGKRRFEYNNLKDCYKQLITLFKTDKTVETDKSSKIVERQKEAIEKIAKEHGYTTEITKEDGVYIIDTFGQPRYSFNIRYGLDFTANPNKFFVNYRIDEQIYKTINYNSMNDAFRKVILLLSKKSLKRDKNISGEVKTAIDGLIQKDEKYSKLLDAIKQFKTSNDKGYNKLLTFLTKELYKISNVKDLIDVDFDGDITQIKNILKQEI